MGNQLKIPVNELKFGVNEKLSKEIMKDAQ